MSVIQNPPAVPSSASTNAVIGKFHNGGKYDIFQIVDSSGGDVLHMNYDGSIEPPIYPLIYKTVLSTSDLHTLSTAPVEIIPAAGSGTVLVPQYFSFQLDVISAFSITNAGTGNTYGYWAGLGSGSGGTTSFAIIPDNVGSNGMNYVSSQSQFYTYPSYTVNGSLSLASIVNQPVMISMDDVLSGGAGNSMLITISYVIVTI
jgi:hypothetical protein